MAQLSHKFESYLCRISELRHKCKDCADYAEVTWIMHKRALCICMHIWTLHMHIQTLCMRIQTLLMHIQMLHMWISCMHIKTLHMQLLCMHMWTLCICGSHAALNFKFWTNFESQLYFERKMTSDFCWTKGSIMKSCEMLNENARIREIMSCVGQSWIRVCVRAATNVAVSGRKGHSTPVTVGHRIPCAAHLVPQWTAN